MSCPDPTPRPEDKPYEEVNHPAHYGGDTPYEVIKVLEAWTDMFRLPVNFTSCIKYLTRAGRKPGVSYEKDLRKAIWHLERELKRVQERDARP